METPIGDDDDSHLGDFIEDTARPCTDRRRACSQPARPPRKCWTRLTPREAKVLRMRFGIEMNTDHTLEEVGKQFDVTRERIRQIEGRGLIILWSRVRVPAVPPNDQRLPHLGPFLLLSRLRRFTRSFPARLAANGCQPTSLTCTGNQTTKISTVWMPSAPNALAEQFDVIYLWVDTLSL